MPKRNSNLSISKRIEISSEIFTKILLSGAEGLSVSETEENRMYPCVYNLLSESEIVNDILDSKLFKPGNRESYHQWVHKIVAEFSSADYLARRFMDRNDPISLETLLPVIAPNSIVREELRGFLGWLAALLDQASQRKLIKLDPYAVLANGDPSILDISSKILLIRELKRLEINNPFFRRHDLNRNFSLIGFFNGEVSQEISEILRTKGDSQLKELVLELLESNADGHLVFQDIRCIFLDNQESNKARTSSLLILLKTQDFDYINDLKLLIEQGSEISLKLISKALEEISPSKFNIDFFVDYFNACSLLYPSRLNRHKVDWIDKYFIELLISKFSKKETIDVLEGLTRSLDCTCQRKRYECECKIGISIIIGRLVDNYFDLFDGCIDVALVWKWIRKLVFYEQVDDKESLSVRVLRRDRKLRNELLTHIFSDLTDPNEIEDTKRLMYDLYAHSGLQNQLGDSIELTNLAFKEDNVHLWSSFISGHRFYLNIEQQRGDTLRSHMRKQAKIKPLLMREWARKNEVIKKSDFTIRKSNSKSYRKTQKWKRKRNQQVKRKFEYIDSNRDLISSGKHWSVILDFAILVLETPEKISEKAGDISLVKQSLINCIDFISDYVPSPKEIAILRSESKGSNLILVLFAACLEIYRERGNLEGIRKELLLSLKTDMYSSYRGVEELESKEINREINRLVFTSEKIIENYVRDFYETQLSNLSTNFIDLWAFENDEIFSSFKVPLSIEWLYRHKNINSNISSKLFELALGIEDVKVIDKLILHRCVEFISCTPNLTNNEHIESYRAFWFIRAFFFLDEVPNACYDWIKSNKDNILIFYKHTQQFISRNYASWPGLSLSKTLFVLKVFVPLWPKVLLPNHWGTDSPVEEKAYRTLKDLIWSLNSFEGAEAIIAINSLLEDEVFCDFHDDLKYIKSEKIGSLKLRDFAPPTPKEIVQLIDSCEIITVESLRQVVIRELERFQETIYGGEFNSADRFYESGRRLDENRCTEIIAERLSIILGPLGCVVTPEHQLKEYKRSDFTVAKSINGERRLLVTEVKGQWNRELFEAAKIQLYERYAIHPDAEQQGIYLVLWFGTNEIVANHKNHGIKNSEELKSRIESSLPTELKGLIDIFVLDLSKD